MLRRASTQIKHPHQRDTNTSDWNLALLKVSKSAENLQSISMANKVDRFPELRPGMISTSTTDSLYNDKAPTNLRSTHDHDNEFPSSKPAEDKRQMFVDTS